MKHSEFSPSQLDRLLRCTKSKEVHKKTPGTVYQLEGTIAHAIAQKILTNKADEYVGRIIKGVTIDEDFMKAVRKYTDYIKLLHTHFGGYLYVEYKFPKTYDDWGTADAIIASEENLFVGDLKFGKGVPVKAGTDNYQLMSYADSALKTFYTYPKYPKYITLYIGQPRGFKDTESTAHITVEDIFNFRQFKEETIQDIKDGLLEFNPSEKACQWCTFAKEGCEAFGRKAFTEATLTFEKFADQKGEAEPIQSISPNRIMQIQRNSGLLKKFLELVEERAIELMKQDHQNKGKKLIHGRKNRVYKDEDGALQYLRNKFEKSEYMKASLITPTEFAALVEDDEVIAKYTEVPKGPARIVNEKAKGEPYEDQS